MHSFASRRRFSSFVVGWLAGWLAGLFASAAVFNGAEADRRSVGRTLGDGDGGGGCGGGGRETGISIPNQDGGGGVVGDISI